MPRIIVEETVPSAEENNSSPQPQVQAPQAGQAIDGVQASEQIQPAAAPQEPQTETQAPVSAEVQPEESQPAAASIAAPPTEASTQDTVVAEQAPAPASTPESTTQAPVTEPAVAASAEPSAGLAPKRSKKPFYIAGVAVLILAVTIGGVLFFGSDSSDAEVQGAATVSQQQTSESEAIQLKNKLSQFMLLPSEEVPTVATVVDVEKVKNQAFFTNAQNGDKVLLFAESGKAILYRPSNSIIVEVAPINLGDK